MDTKRKTQKLKLFLITILLLGAAILLLKFNPLYLGASSDKEIISLFHQHRAAFVKLRKMIDEDRVAYVTERYIDPNLSRARWNKYNALMQKISHSLAMTYSPQSIRFVFSSGGFLSIGPEWTKGIEYVKNPGRYGFIRPSLNNPSELAYGEVYLRKIQHDWFIFFQKDR